MKAQRTIRTTQANTTPINCNVHDYIEIACMYGYELIVELRNTETLHVKAVTTTVKKNENRVAIEYLIADSRTTNYDIPLTEIVKLEAKSESAKFKSIEIESNG